MKDLDTYSILSQIANELLDDLTLDLGKGECGYASYEESYIAVRKNTLKKLRIIITRLKRKMEKEKMEELVKQNERV